jgi:hypothetical protein
MKNRYPTPQELYALEREARRLRAVEMARLFRAAGGALKGWFSFFTGTKVARHA